jgi:hypothetical protein
MRLESGRFLNLDSRNVKLHFRRAQFAVDKEDDYGLKDGDRVLVIAQLDRAVDYAGPLAGHRCGVLSTRAGRKVLVTSEALPVQPKRGDTDKIETYLSELLGPDQLPYFLFWLKTAWESLEAGDFRPGQMIVLAGPSGCGKSLLQSLITEFLGGRAAKPYRYMIGATQFNSDLAAAEHLIIADEQASIDIRSRRAFGAAVKDLCVNLDMSVHAKGREAITLPTYRRVTVSVNDEPENLAILPPMDESILDKIMLFKCAPASLDGDRKRIWKTLTAELPALAFHLTKLRLRPCMQDPRFGVRAYHNEHLLEIVSDISPESRLLSLIEEVIWAKRQNESWDDYKDRCQEPWKGTAIQLEKDLRSSSFTFAVEKLLSFSSACGTYLSRLQNKLPDRFSQVVRRGKKIWEIKKGAD